MSQPPAAAAAARADPSTGATDDEIPVTAEGVAAALKAGTLDLRSEQWRRRLLAAGLGKEDVRWMAAAVDDFQDDPALRVMLAIEAAVALCLGVLCIVSGALEHGETVYGRAARLTFGALLVFIGSMLVFVDEIQRRSAKAAQEQVLPVLQVVVTASPA